MRRRIDDSVIDEDPMVNLTPLIDVVFVVLICFILIAPLLKIDRIVLSGTPQEKLPFSPQAKSQIVIRVFKDDALSLNDEATTAKELLAKLKVLKNSFPQEVPKIYQDKQATFGSYQTVKNCIELAGFEDMDVILRADHE